MTDGVFTFRVFSDGVLMTEKNDVNAAYTGRTTLIMNSNGRHEITVVLVNQENGKECELGRYLFAFDETYNRECLSEDIMGAFIAVDGVSENR